jgi:hypothetical protein
VAQLYPQALGTHFSRLLRHAWVTVGLFFNPGHHTGRIKYIKQESSPATRHGGALGERKYSSYSFMTSALDRGERSASRPGDYIYIYIHTTVNMLF